MYFVIFYDSEQNNKYIGFKNNYFVLLSCSEAGKYYNLNSNQRNYVTSF